MTAQALAFPAQRSPFLGRLGSRRASAAAPTGRATKSLLSGWAPVSDALSSIPQPCWCRCWNRWAMPGGPRKSPSTRRRPKGPASPETEPASVPACWQTRPNPTAAPVQALWTPAFRSLARWREALLLAARNLRTSAVALRCTTFLDQSTLQTPGLVLQEAELVFHGALSSCHGGEPAYLACPRVAGAKACWPTPARGALTLASSWFGGRLPVDWQGLQRREARHGPARLGCAASAFSRGRAPPVRAAGPMPTLRQGTCSGW